jgi:sensor c-di-GMP phosphodiesterase-like protein
MHVQALHRLHLEQDLYQALEQQALEQQEFILHYQPIMDL